MDARENSRLRHVSVDVSTTDARSELYRLLSDPDFRCSERNKRFLEFAAEQLFAGHADSLKAYTIALDVFGRSSNFDPQTDPIVRIEATRLRSCLTSYYGSFGHRTEIWVSLPCGRYVPEFSRVEVANSRSAEIALEKALRTPAVSPSGSSALGTFAIDWRSAAAGIALGLALGLLLAS